jgi:tRNA A37 threonylcarbamoyladenosine modification protein TsaB
MRKKVKVLTIALATPIHVGVYENDHLIESITTEGKSSDVLADIFQKLLQQYDIEALYYANGPGSFMAIKVAYIFLKTLSIIQNIPLYATDAFSFNANEPIKAIGKLHFVKIQDTIQTQKLQTPSVSVFQLPEKLQDVEFKNENAPMYIIGAV